MEVFHSKINLNETVHHYTLTGANSQVLSISLKANEKAFSEPGSMMMMSDGVVMGVSCGNCSRTCVGESCCNISYTNKGQDGFVALTPSFPAKIVPVDLNTCGNHLIAKGGSYMAHLGKVDLVADFDCNCSKCCCGGMGFARQSLKGDGTVFLTGGGTIVMKVLQANESLIVDTTSIVGFQSSVKLAIKKAGGCCTMCCGGEGLFNSVLTGPGLVIIQSMSFEKYKHAVAPPMEHEQEGAGIQVA